jgi:hypothetical protein
LVVLFVAIVGGWVAACIFRRRYLKKHDMSFESKPPVSWGPHQTQSTSGGLGGVYGGHMMDHSKVKGKGRDVENASGRVPDISKGEKRASKIEKKRWNPMQRT